MTNAKVSVVIPSYNSGGTIEEAIESVLAQDVPVEIIVIDDCSLDDTEHVLQKYKNDPRIRIIVNEKNLGVAASRNRGVKEAVCDRVAFLDSDDMWVDGKLVKQLKLMDETGTLICADRNIMMKYPMGNDDIHEDYICWLQILKECGQAVLINEPLLLYRVVKNSKSGSKLSSAKKTFAVYRKLGYGFFRSCLYFANYAVNGVKKYFL